MRIFESATPPDDCLINLYFVKLENQVSPTFEEPGRAAIRCHAADAVPLTVMGVSQVRDVAELAGVSPATVSNALNHPHRVAPRTLSKVQQAIEQLSFIRNDAARQLRVGTNAAVGMVVLDAANPYFANVAKGSEQYLTDLGHPLLLGNSSQVAERELTYLDLFEQQQVSGLLIAPMGNVLSRLRRLKSRGISVVIIDRKSGASEFSSVSVDDERGGWLVADHLINQGAKRIGVIGGAKTLRQVKHRLRGARNRVEETDATSIHFFDTGKMDAISGRNAVQNLIQLPSHLRPDAIFATNDLVALGALQALTRAQVSVPDDILLVGYDDIEFAESATIPISSIRQPSYQMGWSAGELLIQAQRYPTEPVQHLVFKPELIVRDSSQADEV